MSDEVERLLITSSFAAKASSQFLISVFILSLIAGNFVFLKVRGKAIGDSPNMSLKRVFCLSACCQLLWVNSSKWSAVGHSSG